MFLTSISSNLMLIQSPRANQPIPHIPQPEQSFKSEVEGLGTGASATVNDYAAYLMSFSEIPATVPEIGGGTSGFDITTIAIGVTFAAAVVILLVIMRRK